MKLVVALMCLGLSACALMERSPRSGYSSYEEESSYSGSANLYEQRRENVESDAREELGLQNRPLSDSERQAVDFRVRLKREEAKIATKREKRQYYRVRSALRSDRERLYFLSLPTFEARERWAQQRGLAASDEAYSDEVAKTIEGNDISLGMTQKAVSESWGDPDAVETAGNAIYGYERWRYNRYVSGNDGYQKENRIVYFEGGRVVGWERN